MKGIIDVLFEMFRQRLHIYFILNYDKVLKLYFQTF